MGTNFYAKRILNEDDYNRLKELVDTHNLDDVEEAVHEMNREIHLGKRSGGWKFVFDHNDGKYYQPNRKSITEFLSNGMQVLDEYGDAYTVDEFWNKVDSHNACEHNNYTSKTYEDENHGGWHYYREDEIEKCKKLFGVTPDYYDFLSDGLRFSTSTDFA